MRKIRKIWCVSLKIWAKNTDFGLFWPKMANFGPFLAKKGPILNFRPKSETVTFLQLRSHWFMRKIRKIWCADFSENPYVRTDGRTYGRTDVQAWIHRSPRFLETNNNNWEKRAKNGQILAKNGQILAKKLKTRIFAKNLKRHKSKFYGCQLLAKKQKKL